MRIRTSYTAARQRLAELWRWVEEDREAAVISWRGHEDVAMISPDELSSLQETGHLLRSPVNARRLLRALDPALAAWTSFRLDSTTDSPASRPRF